MPAIFTNRTPMILTIGLNHLMAAAIRADLPQARIRAVRPHRVGTTRVARMKPDLVILNASATDATTQRRLIQNAWETVVVVELLEAESRALVWRPPTGVEVVELGPGFLTSFLPIPVAAAPHQLRYLTGLRYIGYAAVAWNLLAFTADRDPVSMLVGFGALPVLVASFYRHTRQQAWGV
jgi:hypothetical protein